MKNLKLVNLYSLAVVCFLVMLLSVTKWPAIPKEFDIKPIVDYFTEVYSGEVKLIISPSKQTIIATDKDKLNELEILLTYQGLVLDEDSLEYTLTKPDGFQLITSKVLGKSQLYTLKYTGKANNTELTFSAGLKLKRVFSEKLTSLKSAVEEKIPKVKFGEFIQITDKATFKVVVRPGVTVAKTDKEVK